MRLFLQELPVVTLPPPLEVVSSVSSVSLVRSAGASREAVGRVTRYDVGHMLRSVVTSVGVQNKAELGQTLLSSLKWWAPNVWRHIRGDRRPEEDDCPSR